MSQALTVKLSKFDNQPWGFRLQGGKDFGTPLSVQKVNGGSLAEQAGLHAGDNILKINGQEVFNLRHKEAQDVLVKAGNNFEITITRGGIWKPQVTPLAVPQHQSNGETLITKTSLTTTSQHVGMLHPPSFNQYPKPFQACALSEEPILGNNNNYLKSERMVKGSHADGISSTDKEVRTVSAHNSVSKPFSAAPVAKANGNSDAKAMNKQFNSPIGLYSEESIAETLSAQAEVLAQGVLGVNFKKNEKSYDATNSEVFKMVQDLDKAPREPEPGIDIDPVEASPQQKGLSARNIQSYSFKRLQETLNVIDAPSAHQEVRAPVLTSGLRHVEPPKPKPESTVDNNANSAAQGAHVRCSECDRLVVGVFVRIKDKNLHVECFKCTICGTSLKNVGYYNINSKLYCDIHARQVARHGPPAPNMEPITVQPDAPIPAHAISAEAVHKLAAPVAAAPAPPVVSALPKPLLTGPTPFSPMKTQFASPVVFGGVNPPPAGGVMIFPPAASRTSQPGAGLGLKGVNKFDECDSTEVTSVLTESSSSVTRQVEVQETLQSYSSSSVTTTEHSQEQVAAPAPAANVAPPHTFSPIAKLGNVVNRPAEQTIPGVSRFVWPPSRTEDNLTSPTATPLYLYPMDDQPNDTVSGTPTAALTQEAPPTLISSHHSDLATQSAEPTIVPQCQASELPSAVSAVELVQSQLEPEVECFRSQPPPPPTPPTAPVVELECLVPVSVPGPAVDTLALGNPAYPTPDLAGLLAGGLAGLSLNAGGVPSMTSGATMGTHSAPRRGHGILKQQVGPGVRVPHCASPSCGGQIRGPFVTALGRTWCPEHFVCHNGQCRRHLQDIGFVEEKNELYCESCFENFLAPVCGRCQKRIKGDCLNAIGKQFHPECFACAYCGRLFGNNHFYLEDGLPYCEGDWNELFTTKCFACKYPIEAGDRWVEAMNNNYHSQCFNCAICKKNLEGQSFLAKGGKPMCKSHAH